MLKILFPYKLYIHILQLEEYSIRRLLLWIIKNPFKRNYVVKKPLVWTSKARFILNFSLLTTVVANLILVMYFKYLALVPCFILSTQVYIFIIISLVVLKPYEFLNRIKTRTVIKKKITQLKEEGLKIIGIAGSYGKTSVKEYLYEMLKTKYKVLKTPESYNTLFGIAKVVDYELDEHYNYFICEMGAYKIGEIKELCSMVLPNHSILTGINEQHLERFKKIENTIKAKFEIVMYSAKAGECVINGNNKYIKENYTKYRTAVTQYESLDSGYYVGNVKTNREGSTFDITLEKKTYKAHTKLVGKGNLENILASATMAYLLKVEPKLIIQTIEKLKPIPHRLEIKTYSNGLLVIEDAYSSNTTGFKAALDLLETYNEYKKIIATPGIIELGAKTHELHKEIGEKIDKICDKVLLIGKNERTLGIQDGITDKSKVVFINSLNELQEHVENPKKSIVLIENDLPNNY